MISLLPLTQVGGYPAARYGPSTARAFSSAVRQRGTWGVIMRAITASLNREYLHMNSSKRLTLEQGLLLVLSR